MFNALHPTLEDREKISKEKYIEHARKLADMRNEILSRYDDDDWNELLNMPYPVKYRIVLKKLQKEISRRTAHNI